MDKTVFVNEHEYDVIGLLGHGKGGYSYLVAKDGITYVLKQIHHEPCDYYTFGNKIESEVNDYKKLEEVGIRLPKMLDVDYSSECILKEYIDGPTIKELVQSDNMKETYLLQVREMAQTLKNAGLNIDYFPTNFIVQDELLFYIDYECNTYMEQWDFEHWGIKYWSKTNEFIDYINKH